MSPSQLSFIYFLFIREHPGILKVMPWRGSELRSEWADLFDILILLPKEVLLSLVFLLLLFFALSVQLLPSRLFLLSNHLCELPGELIDLWVKLELGHRVILLLLPADNTVFWCFIELWALSWLDELARGLVNSRGELILGLFEWKFVLKLLLLDLFVIFKALLKFWLNLLNQLFGYHLLQ